MRKQLIALLSQSRILQTARSRRAVLYECGLEGIATDLVMEGPASEFISLLLEVLSTRERAVAGSELRALAEAARRGISQDQHAQLATVVEGFISKNITLGTDHTKSGSEQKDARGVYISANTIDLKLFRDAIQEEVHRTPGLILLGWTEGQENSEALIHKADLFIGILAFSLTPQVGDEQSRVEYEFRQALSENKQGSFYCLDENAEWKVCHVEQGDSAVRVKLLRDEVMQSGRGRLFSNIENLISDVRESLERFRIAYLQNSVLESSEDSDPLLVYNDAIRGRFDSCPALFPARQLSIEQDLAPLEVRHTEDGKTLEFDAAIGQNRRVVLTGTAGSGKTTLLRLCGHNALKEGRTPLFARLAAYGRTDASLSDYLRSDILATLDAMNGDLSFAETVTFDEKCILLLDGLDEVRPNDRERVVRSIHTFVSRYPRCHVAITSRPHLSLESDFERWNAFEILPIDTDSVEPFVRKNCPVAQQLIAAFTRYPALREMARTPFLLVLLCESWEESEHPMLQRAEVIGRSLRFLLGEQEWDRERARVSDVEKWEDDFNEQVAVLSEVAFHFFCLTEDVFQRDEAVLIATRFIGDSKLAEQTVRRWCVLGALQGSFQELWFPHRSLFEYLAALALEQRDLKKYLHFAGAQHWEEPFRFLAARLGNSTRVVELARMVWSVNPCLGLSLAEECGFDAETVVRNVLQNISKRERLAVVASSASSMGGAMVTSTRTRVQANLALIEADPSAEIVYRAYSQLAAREPEMAEEALSHRLRIGSAEERLEGLKAGCELSFVLLSEGTFLMGCNDSGRDNDKPVHSVVIPAFYMATTPVTNQMFRRWAFLTKERRGTWPDNRLPCTRVTWYEATLFSWSHGCRLPTEGEWEYACRGGCQAISCLHSQQECHANRSWRADNSNDVPHTVGSLEPNAYGLHDMHGNIWELCSDAYSQNYYAECDENGIVVSPKGPAADTGYVVHRGGSFTSIIHKLRCSYRSQHSPDTRSVSVGFRLAIDGKVQ